MGNLGSIVSLKVLFIGSIERATALWIADSYAFNKYFGKIMPRGAKDLSKGLDAAVDLKLWYLLPGGKVWFFSLLHSQCLEECLLHLLIQQILLRE